MTNRERRQRAGVLPEQIRDRARRQLAVLESLGRTDETARQVAAMLRAAAGDRAYTLDAEVIDIDDFTLVNDDEWSRDDIARIPAMQVGDEILFGGGAAPISVLRRIA